MAGSRDRRGRFCVTADSRKPATGSQGFSHSNQGFPIYTISTENLKTPHQRKPECQWEDNRRIPDPGVQPAPSKNPQGGDKKARSKDSVGGEGCVSHSVVGRRPRAGAEPEAPQPGELRASASSQSGKAGPAVSQSRTPLRAWGGGRMACGDGRRAWSLPGKAGRALSLRNRARSAASSATGTRSVPRKRPKS